MSWDVIRMVRVSDIVSAPPIIPVTPPSFAWHFLWSLQCGYVKGRLEVPRS